MSYHNLTDQNLALLLKEGDESVFEILYKRYWDKLYVIASKRLNDAEEAEEVVQDIFLNLWRRKENFTLQSGFDNYFSIAVKFEVINRRAKRGREEERNKQIITLNKNVCEYPMEYFDLEQLQNQLELAINSLPEKCQLVFRMSREQFFTNKKIAEHLLISEKTVEKHKTHALRVLRARFKHYLTLLLF